jgi:hypothetical protein
MTDYRGRIAASKERLDAAIRSDAKRFGHHGPANLIETVRQRHKAALNADYAAQLCRELAGWKGKKP